MRMMQRSGRAGLQSLFAAFVVAAVAWGVQAVSAEDWAQWRGADRLAVWHETGIVESFPDAGLQVKWRAPIRPGYAGPAVAGGRVFVLDWMEDPESRTLGGTERLVALDEETGAELWTHEWPTSYRMLQVSYAVGPRATPTVDGNRVYALGATGELRCLDVATGELIWSKSYMDDYDTSVATWGITSAPLVDGERLIAIVGGEPDALVVAFDKHTGEELWRSLDVVGEMGYGQPIIFEAGGVRQLIVWHAAALASLNPETGAVYWQQPWGGQLRGQRGHADQGGQLPAGDPVLPRLDDDAAAHRPTGRHDGLAGRRRQRDAGRDRGTALAHHDADHHRRSRLRGGQLRRAPRAGRPHGRAPLDERRDDVPGALGRRAHRAERRPLLRRQRRTAT